MSMCFMYFQVGYHSIQQASLQSLSGMMFTSTLGTGADRPIDQSGVLLLMVHLSAKKKKKIMK